MDKPHVHRINAGRVAVLEQVEFFRRQFGEVVSEWKHDDTRVTFADFAISEKIFAELRKSFPRDDYCSEESNPADEVMTLSAKYAWVLDPIDGTNNYALGLPSCAISLALLRDGVPAYGYIYDLSRDRLIEGGPGTPLRDGREKARASTRPMDPAASIVGVGFPLSPAQYEGLRPLLTSYRVRCVGSTALNLAYAATGMLDGAIDFRCKVWDMAGAHALLAAAGGTFLPLAGDPFPLRRFHPASAPRVPFAAGGAAFAAWAGPHLSDLRTSA